MATIIKERKRIDSTYYQLEFCAKDDPTGTTIFAFTCNKDGNVSSTQGGEVYKKNLQECLLGEKYGRLPIQTYHKTYYEPTEIECNHCQRTVVLHSSWANDCECGVEYNGSGQELADRSQWGEETGEQF